MTDQQNDTISGLRAIEHAKEFSKLPDGSFTIAFYPFSQARGMASDKLVVLDGCKFRSQLPQDVFNNVDSENLFLFTDKNGNPKSCYRILIRYMGFPIDNFKLHKINWL